jgi:hypothetical protein
MALSDIDKSPLYIDSTNSRVGIGTSSPSRQLHINDASESNIRLQGSSDYAELRVKDADNAFSFHFGGAERMRIDSSGRVGIGTTSPTGNANGSALVLEVHSSGANPPEILAGGQNAEISIAGGSAASYLWSTGAYPLVIGTNGSEKMRITSSGVVGIGTNSPSGAIVEIFTASTAVNGLKISRYTPGNYYSTLRQDNHGLAIDVGTGGTVSERVAITPNGITFNGDTAAANALDDYEEGTITNLRIYFDTNLSSTSSTGASYVTATGGIYTKIGRLVTVQFYWSGTYNANQVLLKHMENLPFTVGSSNNGFYGGNTSIPYHRGFSGYYRYNTSTDYSNNINLIVTPGTTTAVFKSWAHSFISTGWPLMNAGAGQELSASLTYMTD